MLKQFLILSAIMAAATAGFADEWDQIEKSFVLVDGSAVYIFKDGKMAMEDKFGHVFPMKQGQPMQTVDGQSIPMVGNETARLEGIRRTQPNGW